MLKVRNMTSERTGREVPNQFIITNEDTNTVLFQSYQSPIIEINRDTRIITVYSAYDYSVTTGKYRNKFMSEQGFYELASKKGLEQAMKDGNLGVFIIKTSF